MKSREELKLECAKVANNLIREVKVALEKGALHEEGLSIEMAPSLLLLAAKWVFDDLKQQEFSDKIHDIILEWEVSVINEYNQQQANTSDKTLN